MPSVHSNTLRGPEACQLSDSILSIPHPHPAHTPPTLEQYNKAAVKQVCQHSQPCMEPHPHSLGHGCMLAFLKPPASFFPPYNAPKKTRPQRTKKKKITISSGFWYCCHIAGQLKLVVSARMVWRGHSAVVTHHTTHCAHTTQPWPEHRSQ